MAKMIPLELHSEIKSNAEKKIFNLLKESPGTEEWIVLHSLPLTEVNRKLFGEIDFVVFIPNKGIFVLEVKGGRVKRENGVWSFTNRYNETNQKSESPFEQAKKSAFSLINEIKKRRDENNRHIDHVFFSWGVAFPDIEFSVSDIEINNYQIYDLRSSSITKFFDRLFLETKNKWLKTYGGNFENKIPSKSDIKYLINLLRPDFDFKISISNRINEIESKLIKLTQEQSIRLTEIEDNPRVFMNGSAGTGKTLLAIDAAMRFTSLGFKVALMCFNKNLATWLKNYFSQINSENKPYYTGTIHSLLIDIFDSSRDSSNKSYPNPTINDPVFFDEILPRILLETNVEFPQFDVLIIDESQDILSNYYIQIIDKIVLNGLFDGRWYFFGDYNNQAIYKNINLDDIYTVLNDYAYFSKLNLKTNCRNTVEIYNSFRMYSGMKYDKNVNGIQGLPVELFYYSSNKQALNRLSQRISDLLHNGISPSQITLLSPYKFKNSMASKLNLNIDRELIESLNRVKFSTIYSFKGLESNIVILIDITETIDSKLLYVGMSRAKISLIIFSDQRLQSQFNQLEREYINARF